MPTQSNQSNSNIPPIRTFQFDGSAIGDLQSSVNLFRGDVNLNQTLVSMPGRGDGLEATLTLLYQSNVYDEAMTWNRDAPTGVAGLGWSLPLTSIQLDDGGGPTPGTRQYTFSDGGSPDSLTREPTTPFLFSVSSFGSSLPSGTVPASLVAEFVKRGIALSATATVSTASSTEATLTDDDNEQLFNLTLDGTTLQVSDGGESYQLTSYKFWKTLYYPQYERWLIVKENGQRLTFGGGVGKTLQGYATSTGNSIEWGVRWYVQHPGGTKAAIWVGPSGQTSGQDQYARAWHLVSTANVWGDAVHYGYNEWARNSSGLIPDVEQLVNEGGLPYTKACYLTSIVDVFGRTVTLTYDDKLWSDGDEDPREYADPHKTPPDTSPNAYQDCYETNFLTSLSAYGVPPSEGASGPLLFSLAFHYQPKVPAGGTGNPVANFTSSTGTLFGDTCKRILTGIVQSNACGESLPGLIFDYCFDTSSAGASPGALKSITYPQGGTATYTYTQHNLNVCDRTLAVPPPSGFSGAEPRVFFGEDCAVVTWYLNTGKLSFQIFTWLGRWQRWSLTGDTVLFDQTGGFDLDTLNVQFGESFLALHFETGAGSDRAFEIYVFQRDIAHPGQWTAATIDKTTACNTPAIQYDMATTGPIAVCGGDTFLIVTKMNANSKVYAYDRLTWRWYDQPSTDDNDDAPPGAWTLEHWTVSAYCYATAQNEYYLLLDDSGQASLFYLDPTLAWNTSQPLATSIFQTTLSTVTLVPADSLVAVSAVASESGSESVYTIYLLQWDETYALQLATSSQFTEQGSATVPTIVSNTLVGVGPNLLRFDGETWCANSYPTSALQSGWQQRYAYGPDYGILILAPDNPGANPTGSVLSFDPNSDSGNWKRLPSSTVSLPVPADNAAVPAANWPSSGQADYLSLGQYLYFRGTATCWNSVINAPGQPVADVQELVNQALNGSTGQYVLNSQSVVNQSPQFLAYFVYDTATNGVDQVAATVLKNGQAFVSQGLQPSQCMYTSAESGTGSGLEPGGPSAFTGYPSSDTSFSQASEIYLHRYAGYAIQGALTHYAATGLAIDDGFGTVASTAYAYDLSSAACDPSGLVAKYYTATTYPGTSDPTQPTNGWTVTQYLNGLSTTVGQDFYNMMDGLLYQVQVYENDNDKTPISQTTNTWGGYVQRASDPSDPTAPPINLKGAFVVQTGQQKTVDGVSSSQTTSYVPASLTALNFPYSGQPVSKTSTTTGGDGTTETFTTTMTYGYDVDDVFQTLNMLTAKAQSATTWMSASGGTVTIRAKATSYTSWPCAAGSDVMVPAAEAQFSWAGDVSSAFPFSSYQPGQVPTGWVLGKRIAVRTPLGLVAETADGCGTVQSTLFGDNAFPVARFANASASQGQCAYYGFEPYESGTGFKLVGTTITSTEVHTGEASLEIPADGTGTLSITVTPENQSQSYMLGYWYKTSAGFQPSDGTGWSIVVTVDGKPGTPQTVAFDDTGGQWAYNTIGIQFTAGNSSVSITASAGNKSADAILLDSVFLMPLTGSLQASTFDIDHQLVTSTMNASGRTVRKHYDRFQRLVATVGPNERTKELTQSFLSRKGNADDTFDETCPNASLSLHPTGGGILETFLSGDEWTTRWETTNSTDWTTAAGTLTHATTQTDSLTWRGWDGTAPATAALFFEVVPQGTLAGPVGITFGDTYLIQFDPTKGYSFTSSGGQPVQSPLATPPAMATQWLLVLGCGVVLFFGDGQLLFSQKLSYGTTDTVAIETGPNELQFRNLAMLDEPRLGFSYSDAAGRQRQVHQLYGQPQQSTSDARIVAIVHDALDRKVAVTRTAPASFGTDADLPLLAYRSNFADVSGFLQNMATTWALTGDVADYYAGQSDGPVTRSNDQGYSYRGYRFLAAPLKRQIERGLPGKAYAICDVNTTTPQQRQTTQYSYSANADADPSLPPGDYAQKTITSPTKSQAVSIKDTAGRQVFSSLADSGGSLSSRTTAVITYADDSSSGATRKINLPNAFTKSPQTDPSAYVSTVLHDPVGRVASEQQPSTGTTLSIYDPVGRLRFVQPALDTGETWFLYYKYDPLGRILEEGTVSETWNAADLQTYAAEPGWPTNDVTHTVARTYQYDGDGNDPTAIGQVFTVVTNNPAPSANSGAGDITVTEKVTHDSDGRVASVEMTLTGAVTQSGTVTYQYNNLNEPTTVGYPGSAAITEVLYSYDDQGHVVAIGSAAGTPSDIAAYTFSADGHVQTEARNAGTLSGAYQYYSPGWLQQQTETVGSATTPSFCLAYTYNADATMATRTMKSTLGSTSRSKQVTYAYDGQRRLTSATVADGQPGNETVSSYDANGNIWGVTQDGAAYSFTCAPGSDRLQSATLAGTPVNFQYSADGWLTQGNGYAIERDPCLDVTMNVTVSGTSSSQVRFAYGAAGQRVLKQVSGASQSTQVYFCGSGKRPLASVQDGAWTAFVRGPTGLVAAADTARYFPLRDLQGTVWAVVDDQNTLVAQYDYLPFGGPLSTTVANPNVIGQRFMGQALDVETGLYNFQARMYDPVLRRFCSPDPAAQFPSPYVFVGNDPLTMIDPSGDMSTGAQIGLWTGFAALLVLQIAVTVATAGAALPAEVGADTGIVTGETTVTTTTELVSSTDAAVVGSSPEGAVGSSGNALSSSASLSSSSSGVSAEGSGDIVEVSASENTPLTSTSGQSTATGGRAAWAVARAAASSGFKSGLQGMAWGAGRASLQYTLENQQGFSWATWGEDIGLGAAGGFISGFIGGSVAGALAAATWGAPAGALSDAVAAGKSGLLLGGWGPVGAALVGTTAAAGMAGLLSAGLEAWAHPAQRGGGARAFGENFIAGALTPIGGPGAAALAGWGYYCATSPASAAMVDHVTATAKLGDAAAVHATSSAFLMGSYKPRRRHG